MVGCGAGRDAPPSNMSSSEVCAAAGGGGVGGAATVVPTVREVDGERTAGPSGCSTTHSAAAAAEPESAGASAAAAAAAAAAGAGQQVQLHAKRGSEGGKPAKLAARAQKPGGAAGGGGGGMGGMGGDDHEEEDRAIGRPPRGGGQHASLVRAGDDHASHRRRGRVCAPHAWGRRWMDDDRQQGVGAADRHEFHPARWESTLMTSGVPRRRRMPASFPACSTTRGIRPPVRRRAYPGTCC
jgi:hypothetical protein